VVEDPDTDKVADFAEAAGDLDVFLRGRGVTGWVVVNECDGGGAVADDLSVNVTRMNDAGREGALGDEHVTEFAVLVVEENCVEIFDGFAREASRKCA